MMLRIPTMIKSLKIAQKHKLQQYQCSMSLFFNIFHQVTVPKSHSEGGKLAISKCGGAAVGRWTCD